MSEEVFEQLSEKIQERIILGRFKQRELASYLGCSQSYISKSFHKNYGNLKSKYFIPLCFLLGLDKEFSCHFKQYYQDKWKEDFNRLRHHLH